MTNQVSAERGSTMVKLQARPQEVEIDIARTAIVVVDMQNAYASKGGMLDLGTGIDEARIGPVIAANKRLLPAARTAGVKVIYLQFGYKPDLSDAGGPHSPNIRKQMAFKLIKERPEVRDKLIIEGTWGFQIIDDLKPEPGDLVVQKPRYSGFAGTNLEIAAARSRHPAPDLHRRGDQRVRGEHRARGLFPRILADPGRGRDRSYRAGLVRQATLYNFESKLGWVTKTDDVLRVLMRNR